MKNTALEDFKINIKVKLAFLWTSVTFLYIYGDYFELYVPGKLTSIIGQQSMLDNPLKLFLASILLAIPAFMIAMSIILKPALNKSLNIICGLFFTAIMLLIAVTSYSQWRTFYVFYALAESVLTFTIVYNAMKWPKQTQV